MNSLFPYQDLQTNRWESFHDFITSQADSNTISLIRKWPTPNQPQIIVYAPYTCGKSHLLQAAYSQVQTYSDLFINCHSEPQPLLPENLQSINLLVIDHLDHLTPENQIRLFHWFNTAHQEKYLLTASRLHPTQLPFSSELLSRLTQGTVFTLNRLDKEHFQSIVIAQTRQLFPLAYKQLAANLIKFFARDLNAIGHALCAYHSHCLQTDLKPSVSSLNIFLNKTYNPEKNAK